MDWETRRKKRQEMGGAATGNTSANVETSNSIADAWERRRSQRRQMDAGSEEARRQRSEEIDRINQARKDQRSLDLAQDITLGIASSVANHWIHPYRSSQAGQTSQMTAEEAGQKYKENQAKIAELDKTVRMGAGKVHTPEVEAQLDALEKEQNELAQYIRQLEDADAMQHDSAYWAKKASHEQARLREANAYRSGYGGVMQSGILPDTGKEQNAEAIQREYDKAREYYYAAKNAEDWSRMTPELQEKAMAAAALDVNGIFDWQKGDTLSRSGLSPDQRAAQSKDEASRLAQLRQEISDAGFDADRILDYANRLRNQQRMQETVEEMTDFASGSTAGAIAATAASYGSNLLSGIGSVGILAQRIFGSGSGVTGYRPVDYNAPSTIFSQVTSATRGAVSAQMGETGQFLYGTLNSAVDSAARMLIAKAIGTGFLPDSAGQAAVDRVNRIVSGAVSAQMSTQVFTDAFLAAKQSGATDDDAILDALVQASIEGITEKYSVDSILKNPNNLVLTALRNNFIAEGSEEIASDFLNTIYDELKNGSDSELRSAAQKYIDAGLDPKEAWKLVLQSYAKQVVLDGLAGGISGIAMGGAAELADYTQRLQAYTQPYADRGNVQALVDEALELDPENPLAASVQRKLSEKGEDSVSNREIYRLVRQNETAIQEGDRAAVQSAAAARLSELGETGDVEAIGAALAKQAAGEELSGAERELISSSRYGQRVANELDPEKIRSGEFSSSWAERIGTNRLNPEEYSRLVEAAQLPGATENEAAEQEVQAEKPAEKAMEAAVEEKPAAAATVREQRTVETGEAAEETTVEATEQENPVTLDEASKKYGAQAGAMVHTYQPGQDVAAYDRAYEIAYEMGRSVVKRSYAMKSAATAYLTETQRELAYEAGQAAGRQNLKESGMTRMGNGTVTMQGGAKDAKLNARQKASVQFLRVLAKITGIDFVVYQSEADSDGNLQGANGYYRNGTVHVDLNAGAMKEGELERAAMLRTVSHEMTHYIAETAPKEYQALQTFLLDKLSGMQDGSLEDLTERKLARAKAAGHPISYGQALEEVVADGCEMMLRDSEAVRTLAKENRGLFETVKDWLSKFLDNLRKAFSGVDAAHQESRYLMENYAKELQELWDAGLMEAVQHTKLENKSVSMSEINEEKADKNSERDYSYEALTSKPDMAVTLVDDTAPKNRADVVAQAKKNAAKVGRFDPKTGSVSVHVNDIDTDVVLATNGLKHSLDRRLGVNAAVVVNAGEIIQNSIRINEMTAQKNEAESSYVLIGAARNENGDMYIVRSVVNRFSNELTSLDVLYAINAKKELAALNAPRLGATPLSETNSFNGNQAGDYPQGSRSDDRFLTGSVEPAALNAPRSTAMPLSDTDPTISISKLLDYVNRYFPDILPESVLRHYGHGARPEGKLGESALYQERDADITDADILEQATLRAAENDRERNALREYQRTLGEAQKIQQEWDRQTELAETAKDRSAAAKARNRADIRQRQYERAQDRLRKLQEGAVLQSFLRREQAYVQGRQDYETAAERQPGRYSDRFEERLDRGYQVSREIAERYAALNQTYGSIETGENPARDIEVPRRTEKDKRVSQTVRTAMEAGATNEETVGALMEAVTKGNFSYLPITDKKAKAWAEEYIRERTWDEAAGDLQKTMGKGRLGKKDVALGFHLYNHYVQEGQTKEAVRLLVDLSERIREGAQAVQAVRMLKQLSPDHQVYALTQSIHSLQKELDSRYGDKAPKLRMDDVLVRNYLEAEGDEAVEAARKALYQSIANQLPNTWVDKWNSWRYLAMLSSPRTHIRNTFGNAGFVAVRKTKDIVAALMEHGYEAVTGKQGERTKVMFHDKALLEAARADYPNVVDLLDGAGKYSQAIGEIEEMKPAFGDKGAGWKALSKAADFNTRLLTVEDRWFSKPAYIGALAGYLQAKGITAEQFQTDEAIRAEARGYAVKEAQRATYRDFNDFSDFLASIGRRTHGNATMNKVEKTVGVLMEGVLPFRRTPANILVRAVDYSPIGLLRGVKQACVDVRAGEKTAAEAIDLLASGLTGTALLGFGALLCYAGLLTPPEDPDDKQAGFDDLQGKQAYSLHIGDRYYTVDWLAPEALPVFVGAEIGAYFKDRGERNGTALDAILRISEPMLEMSMLSSLNDLLDNLSYSDNKLLTILSSATFSYLTQCLPTVFGQAERVGETERETTFINRDSRLNGDLQYILANAANKAPGLEYQQIPYIDAWGRHEDTGNVAARVFNNLFNPAYVSEEQVEPFEAELQRLYNLGYTEVLPQRVPQSTKVSGNNLTAEQYVTYAETKGAVQHDAIRDIVGSDWYSGMSDAVRDELISKAYDYAAASAKLAVDGNADVPQWVLDTMDAVKSGEELAGLLRERVDEGAVDFRTEYPEFSDLSNSAIGKYTEFCEDAGISARQFYDAYGDCSEFTADKDENGESISGSKKQKVVDYILGLGLSREQERALWNAVKDKTWVDKDTPWA